MNAARRYLLSMPPEEAARQLIDAVNARPDRERITGALMPRLMNNSGVSWTGAQFTDTLNDNNPNQLLAAYVYPYPQITGGASTTVIGADEQKEPYLLVVRKFGETSWGLPAGFMDPRKPVNKQNVNVENTDERFAYDVALLQGGPAAVRDNAKPVNRITAQPQPSDKTLADTAAREVKEETGVTATPEQMQFVSQATETRERPSAMGPQPEQQQNNYYLLDLRARGSLPALQPKIGGNDIEEARWVKLSGIRKLPDGSARAGETTINAGSIAQLEAALGMMRKNEMEASGITAERVYNQMQTPKPASELGAEAITWHEEALKTAANMQRVLAQYTQQTPAQTGKSL